MKTITRQSKSHCKRVFSGLRFILDNVNGSCFTLGYIWNYWCWVGQRLYSSKYFIVFMTVMGIMGSLGAMDDIATVAKDAADEEKKTHVWERFDTTQWGAFKGLMVFWFGGTALAELYVMWLA